MPLNARSQRCVAATIHFLGFQGTIGRIPVDSAVKNMRESEAWTRDEMREALRTVSREGAT